MRKHGVINWAISVKGEIPNTEITNASSIGIVTHRLRNNEPTSVRHPYGMNMYAEQYLSCDENYSIEGIEVGDKKPLR